MSKRFDLIVRRGTVIDGTGSDPRTADVAVRDGRIAAVGHFDGSGREEIEATGLAVTPGFVDIHTHYDGQATWDDRFVPSSGHGVTSVLMGNCGVGFAPCRPQDHDTLIKVMEGVEDIPEIVMREGVPYRIIGGVRFYERKEIKDVLAYLRLVINPHDDVSLRRVINVPARGIGKGVMETLEKIEVSDQADDEFPLLAAGLAPAVTVNSLWSRLVSRLKGG